MTSYLDKISEYIENNVLDESEKGFNQVVMYGRDVSVDEIVWEGERTPIEQMAELSGVDRFLSSSDLQTFIQHYEKLTKWMMKTMPAKADILIKIDSNQKIKKVVI